MEKDTSLSNYLTVYYNVAYARGSVITAASVIISYMIAFAILYFYGGIDIALRGSTLTMPIVLTIYVFRERSDSAELSKILEELKNK